MKKTNTHRKYSREFKFQVVRPVASGEKSPKEVCREHDLANSVLDRWRKEYDQFGEEAFQQKRKWLLSRPVGESTTRSVNERRKRRQAPVAVVVDDTDQGRTAQLERLCVALALENFLLKKQLRQRAEHSLAGSTGRPA